MMMKNREQRLIASLVNEKNQGLLIQLIKFLFNFVIDTNRCCYMEKDSEKMKILCIGVGGAGTNVINRMKDIGVPNAEFLTFGGYRYDYSHPEIPHYNLIEVNEIDSLPNGSGAKVFERLANNVADDIKEVLLYHLNSCKLENERV